MVQNIYNNIPPGVKIQIFHSHDKSTIAGLEMSQSILELQARGVVVLTPISPELLRMKKKKVQLLTDPWVWRHMLGEKVLLFAGTTAICSNAPHSLGDFLHFDYIGSPWTAYKGFGGEGGISVRSRQLMLDILRFEEDRDRQAWTGDPSGLPEYMLEKSLRRGAEDDFFVSRILQMRKKLPPSAGICYT